jgi:hypothetical protein
MRALGNARERKTVAYVRDIYLPTQLSKLADDASIISIPAGWCGEISGHAEYKVRSAARSLAHRPDPAMFEPAKQIDPLEVSAKSYR